MKTIIDTVELEAITCGKCAGTFALNNIFLSHARSNKGAYHCPYCDTRWSWSEGESDRLRKQLEEKERELRESKCEVLKRQQLLDLEKAKSVQAERRLNRSNNGVCTCCNRTFANLARHMKTKHPKTA